MIIIFQTIKLCIVGVIKQKSNYVWFLFKFSWLNSLYVIKYINVIYQILYVNM